MREIKLLFFLTNLLLLLSNNNSYSQATDSVKNLRDSLCIIGIDKDTLCLEYDQDTPESRRKKRQGTFISEERTDEIFSSLFGDSKKLSNADSLIKRLDAMPPFGIYKDNFFIAGTQMFSTPTRWNSDAKFQISIRHRLTNSTLPFKTYLFFTYTQKAFWDVFKESFPFRDLNYNPTIGIGRILTYKNRVLGSISLQFEHESNGKDGIDSRSWNKITFGSTFLLHDRWVLESEMWIPIVDGGENKDIVKYAGWANMSIEYTSPSKKYVFGAAMTKRGGWNLNHNLVLSLTVRMFNNSNQFFFVEYYDGYGESMLDYKQHRQRLRAGFVIKPDFMNFF